MNHSSGHQKPFLHIPTTIITGFLGSGKTTLINHLLSAKPPTERWAVLVNEFGQVGVDGAMLGTRKEVSIREIPGGCLCCTAGRSFETALNRLIREADPHRILIEPTGIGHPLKIIRTLTGGFYREVLDLRAIICLLDARKLADPRYRTHPSFQDQLTLADVLAASKADCYQEEEREAFMQFSGTFMPQKSALTLLSFGNLDLRLLDLPRNPLRTPDFPHAHPAPPDHHPHEAPDEKRESTEIDSWTLHEGSGDGCYSGSWLIGSAYRFDKEKLLALFSSIASMRIKGIMQCREGWLQLNGSDADMHTSETLSLESTRLEIMNFSPLPLQEIDRHLRNTLCDRESITLNP